MNQTLAQSAERPEDIFDLNARATDAKQSATAEARQQPAGGPAKKTVLDHIAALKTFHLVLIVSIIVVSGLAYIHMARNAPPVRTHEAQYIDPNAAMEAPSSIPPAKVKPATTPQQATTQEKAGADSPSSNRSQGETHGTEAPADSERIMIRNALENLNARLSVLEQHATSQATQVAHQVTGVAAGTPHRLPKHGVRVSPERSNAQGMARLGGYTLNTIFNDQAWIDHDGKTYVVQPGDHIGELRIVSIDARARRVLTSNGSIN